MIIVNLKFLYVKTVPSFLEKKMTILYLYTGLMLWKLYNKNDYTDQMSVYKH